MLDARTCHRRNNNMVLLPSFSSLCKRVRKTLAKNGRSVSPLVGHTSFASWYPNPKHTSLSFVPDRSRFLLSGQAIFCVLEMQVLAWGVLFSWTIENSWFVFHFPEGVAQKTCHCPLFSCGKTSAKLESHNNIQKLAGR